MIATKSALWVIISFVLNLLFGSSFILGYLKYKHEVENMSAQKLEITANLRDKVGAKLYEITRLTEEYLDAVELNKKKPSPAFANKVNQLRQRLDLLKADFIDLEKQLAGLEKRDARKINIDFIPPAPPMNLRIE